MSFIEGVLGGIGKFKEAVKAGGDFNPLLEEVMNEIEKLHTEGKIPDVVFQAEQAYVKEHGEYKLAGNGAGAADHKKDAQALKHFIEALVSSDNVPAELKEKIQGLAGLEKKMEEALGSITKLL